MDNLKQLEQNVDIAIPIGGGVASVKTINHNPQVKNMIKKIGRYTGFPFNSQRSPSGGSIPAGSFFWDGNAMNKNNAEFELLISETTVDGNNISRILENASSGDIIHFKDYVGRSTLLKYLSHQIDVDVNTLNYYKVLVIGFPENTNYSYQVGENEPCIIEFIKNTKIFDTRLISYVEPTIASNVYDFPPGQVARIKGVNYVVDTLTPITIPFASSGNERIDFIVFGTTGIIRVPGTEAPSNPSSPTLTDEQILLRIVKVDDGSVVDDTPSETMTDTTANHFRGEYDAGTNSPALSDGTGQIGDIWRINGAGTRNFGSGNIVLNNGDYIIYFFGVYHKYIDNNQVTNILNENTFGTFASGLTTENAIADGDIFNYTDVSDTNKQKKTTWSNIKSVLKTYFDTLYQNALTGLNFGTFINGLTSKNPPVDADEIVIKDSADSNKAKRVSFTNLKAFLKTYFDTLYNVPQITITTAVNITVITLDGSSRSQKGRNVVIDNGATPINIATDTGSDSDFVATYLKHGTGAITFTQGAGTTLIQVDGTNVLNGAVGSTATLSRVGTTFYLRISNA